MEVIHRKQTDNTHSSWHSYYDSTLSSDCYYCIFTNNLGTYQYYITPNKRTLQYKLRFITMNGAAQFPCPAVQHNSVEKALECASQHYDKCFSNDYLEFDTTTQHLTI